MKFVCTVCGFIYDEEKEQVPFAELPESWVCPLCKAAKSAFRPEAEPEQKKAPAAPVQLDEDMLKLSAGELSALFSNLARGCEKQYQNEARGLFQEIADYFEAAMPAQENADMDHLAQLIREDLDRDYVNLRANAGAEGDRGALRVCTWGEKVTNIVNSLVQRYLREGEAFLNDTNVWVCTVCGFIYVGEEPPELCPVCKVPSWKFEKMEGRVRA